MSLIACPGCGMPRTAEDLVSRPCPLCGGDPPAEPTTPPVAVAAITPLSSVVVPSEVRRSTQVLLLAIAVLVPVAVGAVIYFTWSVPEAEPVSQMLTPPAPVVRLPEPAIIEVAPRPRSVVPRPVAVAETEVAPLPRVAVAPPVPMEPVAEPAEGVVVLNKPDGEHVLPDTDGAEPIILTGEIGTLRLGRVFGRANVDASKLRAKVVIVGDRVDGEATLRLRATDRVEFRERIHGAATLSVEAPGGVVRFATAARIDGEAKVHVSAAKVEFAGKVDGGCHLTVTAGEVVFDGEWLSGGARIAVTARVVDVRSLMAGGVNLSVAGADRITHKDMEEGARLTYRKASPSDPKPTVSGGELRGGATVSPSK